VVALCIHSVSGQALTPTLAVTTVQWLPTESVCRGPLTFNVSL
jgi:hypothetical protein